MSEGVYEISDGFEDEPDAIKNTDIDGQSYANVRAFKPSPRDVVVASVHVQWWKRPSGVAAVCLGLLCVLLLAGIIGLSVYYGVIGHHDSKLREQLQTSYNTMTKERDQLQTERDVLSGWLTSLKQTCPERWQKFESSCYFLSTETKTWKESREDCLQRGADLVIINNNKEQEFLFILNHTTAVHVWIGLTDSVTEGTWRWVDGTPLTTPRYWSSHQPDNGDRKPEYGVEDCVQIRKDQSPLEAWNDVSCRSKLNWVCEKVF
ncbi:C-type lectin domain family 4 member E-like isoform X1 [Oncorhynchus tshawytscha]|uniref:C-type lectin domain-containing protein n=1 Tax=Oncorhynchus tshawytscha TaxID=74940 RepID=A0AAZ3RSR3_ONCTS|nr:C-type lectin domain family 4 member E-like isoform X1 [Oncorhynchus tshawytscha]